MCTLWVCRQEVANVVLSFPNYSFKVVKPDMSKVEAEKKGKKK